MKKKVYVKPALEVIQMEMESQFLASSNDFGGTVPDMPWETLETSSIDWDNYSMDHFGPDAFGK